MLAHVQVYGGGCQIRNASVQWAAVKKAKPWSTKPFLVCAVSEQFRSSDWVPFLGMCIVHSFSLRLKGSNVRSHEKKTGVVVKSISGIFTKMICSSFTKRVSFTWIHKDKNSHLQNEYVNWKKAVKVKLFLNLGRSFRPFIFSHTQHFYLFVPFFLLQWPRITRELLQHPRMQPKFIGKDRAHRHEY